MKPSEVWVSEACMLPTIDQPLRIAEWDDLFGFGLQAVRRDNALSARFELHRDLEVALQTTALAVKESGCCSFFTFALTVTGANLTLDISVPEEHVAVLDALVQRVDGHSASD